MLKVDDLHLCILKKLSAQFERGVLHGLIGENGSGKTTLLKSLAGVLNPEEGEVLWEGMPLRLMARKERSKLISYVPHLSNISFPYSVWEIVEMGRYPHGDAASAHGIIEEAIRKVNAWDLRERPFNRLSQGERQRAVIARSLATEAPILLLDEPTANLDIRHKMMMWELLRNLVSEQKLVIASTHDLRAARDFCAQLTMLSKGECLIQGPSEECARPEYLAEAFQLKLKEAVKLAHS